MKIAMPVDENYLVDGEYTPFGHTPYFVIYDSDENTSVIMDNNEASCQYGADIKTAQCLISDHIDVLITPICNEKVLNILKSAKVEIYKSISGTFEDNTNAFKEGKLSLIK